MITTSHHRYIISILLALLCYGVGYAQSVEDRMDDIKIEGKCWYGEGVAKTKEEAYEKAITDLLSLLSQNGINKFDKDNVKDFLSEMHFTQNGRVTMLVYATKEKLQAAQVQQKIEYHPSPVFQHTEPQGTQHQQVVEQTGNSQPTPQQQSISQGAATPSTDVPDTWEKLPTEMRIYLNISSPRSQSAKNVLRHLASSRDFGDIQVFKHQSGTPFPKDMFIFFFQGDTSKAVLSPDTGKGRVNVNSKTADSCDNYQDCEAVQFKMIKK